MDHSLGRRLHHDAILAVRRPVDARRILTGSSAGTTGAPTMSVYGASKAAVRNLARTWAEDLKGTGIRVNVLSPGPTATELAKAALGEEGQSSTPR